MNADKLEVFHSVVISVQEKSMQRIGDVKSHKNLLQELLDKGMAAQLKLQSLLTGLLLIDVDFYPKYHQQYVDIETDYPQFPTVKTDFEELSKSLEDINIKELVDDAQKILDGTDKFVNNPQTQQLSGSLNSTLLSIKDLSDNLQKELQALSTETKPAIAESQKMFQQINQQLPQLFNNLNRAVITINQTLKAVEQTTKTLDKTATQTQFLLSDDSPLLYELNRTAQQLQKASDNIAQLSTTLDQQPESLIKGKQGQ